MCLMKTSRKFKCKRFAKYAGSCDVPVFVCHLSRGERCNGKTYYVRAVSFDRFINQSFKAGFFVIVIDYRFEFLRHGELYRSFPNL